MRSSSSGDPGRSTGDASEIARRSPPRDGSYAGAPLEIATEIAGDPFEIASEIAGDPFEIASEIASEISEGASPGGRFYAGRGLAADASPGGRFYAGRGLVADASPDGRFYAGGSQIESPRSERRSPGLQIGSPRELGSPSDAQAPIFQEQLADRCHRLLSELAELNPTASAESPALTLTLTLILALITLTLALT